MIQRIQSIYLLIVSILMLFMLVSPIVEIEVEKKDSVNETTGAKEIVVFRNYGAKRLIKDQSEILIHTIPVTILICIIGLISFFNIFFYAARSLQMRICIFNMLLLAGLTGLIYYYFTFIKKQINAGELEIIGHTLKISVIFPVISIILTYLAFRSVRRDELLVKSYERLRK